MKDLDWIHIGAWASVLDEDNILWLSSFHFNGLFKYDLNKEKMRFVGLFDKAPIYAEALHQKMYLYGTDVFIFPLRDHYIWVYSKKENKLHAIPISLTNENLEFYNVVIWNNKAWLITTGSEVYEFDFNSKKIKIDRPLSDIIHVFSDKANGNIFITNYMQNIVVSEEGGNRVLQIKLDTRTTEEIFVNQDLGSCCGVYFDGDRYWLTLKDSLDLVSWDNRDKQCVVYKNCGNMWNSYREEYPYSEIFFHESQVWVTNYYSDYIMKVNEENRQLEIAFAYPKGFRRFKQCGYGAVCKSMNLMQNTALFIPQRGNMLLTYKINQNKVEGKEMKIHISEIPYAQEIIIQKMRGCNVLTEEECINVGDYLLNLCNGNFVKQQKNTKDVGKNVWEYIS